MNGEISDTNTPDPEILVHGLGYVGLPTAAALANSGFDVYGFDVDNQTREELISGNINLNEQGLERFVERALDDGLSIVDEIESADFHLICVPTPFDRELNKTDLSYVRAAGESVSEVLRGGDTVVLNSTVPPGTTAKILRPVLERSHISAVDNFLLGYCPETVLPGNTLTELRENDRLIGTVGGKPHAEIVALYESFVTGEIRTTDATTAEFVKLIQNAHRDVNIAFANEVAKLAREFGVDSRCAIAFANEHPRVDILDPGPGVGGHCIPIDPLFLKYKNDVPKLIEAARHVNDGMVRFVTEILSDSLGDLNEKSVTLLGMAYKGGVADTRMSPALSLAKSLRKEGVELRITDPYVAQDNVSETLLPLEKALESVDAAVLVTDHPEFGALDPEVFFESMQGNVIVDTRNMIDDTRWEKIGLDVYIV